MSLSELEGQKGFLVTLEDCMFIKSFDEKLNLKPSRIAQIRRMKAHKKTLMDENMRLKISQQQLKVEI